MLGGNEEGAIFGEMFKPAHFVGQAHNVTFKKTHDG